MWWSAYACHYSQEVGSKVRPSCIIVCGEINHGSSRVYFACLLVFSTCSSCASYGVVISEEAHTEACMLNTLPALVHTL
jgi:cephalosporin hydroxylase